MSIPTLNRVLHRLPTEERARLAVFLERIELPARHVLIHADAPVDRCYFLESGLVSVVMQVDATRVEVGMIGTEGVVCGPSLLIEGQSSPYAYVVQIAGVAHGIALRDLRGAVRSSPALGPHLQRCVQAELFQSRHTAFVNASFSIETRLARWLLMCHDRVEGDELALTHEVLAVMLGVQRSGVTLAVQNLEGSGRIRARRGRITILDRERLRDAAGGSYGIAEAFHERLMAEV
jgi:CRP-like cAMP-binding protein